jgi:hypothetical protein
VIRAALEAGARSCGVLLHWYSGGIDSERIHIERRDFPVADMTTELLHSLPENTLFSFHH